MQYCMQLVDERPAETENGTVMTHTKIQRKAPSKPTRAKAPKPSPRAKRSIAIAAPQPINVADLRRHLGLSQEELARLTGYSTRSIAGWESRQQQLSASARQKLTETTRLTQALADLMPPNQLPNWLRTPNPAFEGQSPIQIIERGESDRLWQMIFQIDANVAN